MKKAIVQIGYTNYVLDTPKAIALFALLDEAEIYEKKYHSSSSTYTHHIYKREMDDDTQTLKLINKSFYDMAKLADKPIST
jgi:Tfp pilus assembly protein PilE